MPESCVITAGEAILEAQDQALAADPAVFLMGEGAADPKGIFGTTVGLVDKYGPARVMEMPVSENGFTGVAVGAALMGLRPIVIHQRVEFCLLAMEQIFGNAAKAHYVSDGKHKAPMVVRLVSGRGWGQGPQHGQVLENLFGLVPGLKLVLPSNPADAKGMLLAAVADDNPVIFLEHRWIHYVSGEVPVDPIPTPLDGPRRVHDGDDVTVVASSYMTLETRHVAQAMAAAGVGVDLFDLRVARPLDTSKIEESVRRTGRLLVVDTGWRTFGLGAEIVARVTENCFADVKAPPRRVGLPDHPTPSSRALAEAYYPRSEHVAGALGDLVGLPADRIEALHAQLAAERREVPLDVPHPSFKGPF